MDEAVWSQTSDKLRAVYNHACVSHFVLKRMDVMRLAGVEPATFGE